jgi:hypothetical protein
MIIFVETCDEVDYIYLLLSKIRHGIEQESHFNKYKNKEVETKEE